MSYSIEIVNGGEGLEAVRKLWWAYWHALGLPSDFQGFAEELDQLPGKYGPPKGRLFLVQIDGQPAATAAFRALNHEACEAKRLYVHPAYRRRGIAGDLMAKLVDEARALGYQSLYADTLPTMDAALRMYREIGFVEVGPYADNPTPGAIYLRLEL
jgi:ribosomal protein S18 acetylase RimI-like enzyme